MKIHGIVLLLVGCGSSAVDTGRDAAVVTRDAAARDAIAVVHDDAAARDALVSADAAPADDAAPMNPDASPAFAFLVTESPPGAPTVASWRGVLQYTATTPGAPLIPVPGIASARLADPAGLAFRRTSSEVFVGNRHGNNSGDGVAGSICRFRYDSVTRTFTGTGTITGNGLDGVHQLAFDPISGDLFAANVRAGVSRFSFDAAGNAVAAGTLASGPIRGVLVSPDGHRLFATTAGDVIRVFDLTNAGAELPSFTVAGGANLHYLALRSGEVYVAGLDLNRVYRLTLSAASELALRDSFPADSPIGIAFSPDGREMIVAGHRASDVIQRYDYDAALDTWAPGAIINTTASLGGLMIIP